MKALLLALLLPLSAHATSVACLTEGTMGEIKLSLNVKGGSLSVPKSIVTINANGMLQTVFTAVVDEVLESPDNVLKVRVTTLNKAGLVDQESGVAEIEVEQIHACGMELASGKGSIVITKRPHLRSPTILLPRYDLKTCSGRI